MGIFSSVKNLFGGSSKQKIKRIIDDLQIEITHLSPLKQSEPQYMAEPTFTKLANNLTLAKRIHFKGWGDPLIHPQALDFIKQAQERQPRLSITTTGSNLSQEVIDQLVAITPDKIIINLHYPEHTINNIQDNLSYLLKQKPNSLKISLDYTMTTENIAQIPQSVESTASLHVEELSLSNLNFLFSSYLNDLKVFDGNISEKLRGDLIKQGKAKGKAEYEEIIAQSEKIAKQKGIYFNPKPLIAKETVMCEYSPLNSTFINWQGKIAPCSCLSLENCQVFFNGQVHNFNSLIIGDINYQDLSELWNDPSYMEFRDFYKKRVQVFNKYMEETFEDEPSMDLIFNNYQKLDQQLLENKLPEPCTKCYKAYGI